MTGRANFAYYSNGDYSSCHAPLNFFPDPPRPNYWPDVMSFRSLHPGGANFGLRSGGCDFLSETIDPEVFKGWLRGTVEEVP